MRLFNIEKPPFFLRKRYVNFRDLYILEVFSIAGALSYFYSGKDKQYYLLSQGLIDLFCLTMAANSIKIQIDYNKYCNLTNQEEFICKKTSFALGVYSLALVLTLGLSNFGMGLQYNNIRGQYVFYSLQLISAIFSGITCESISKRLESYMEDFLQRHDFLQFRNTAVYRNNLGVTNAV